MSTSMPIGRKACRAAQFALCFDAPNEPLVRDATPNAYGALIDHCVVHRYAASSRLKRTIERHKASDDYVALGYSAARDYRDDFLELQFARYRDRWHWSASSQCHQLYWGGAPSCSPFRISPCSAGSFEEARQQALSQATSRLQYGENSSDPGVAAAAKRLLALIEADEYKEIIQ